MESTTHTVTGSIAGNKSPALVLRGVLSVLIAALLLLIGPALRANAQTASHSISISSSSNGSGGVNISWSDSATFTGVSQYMLSRLEGNATMRVYNLSNTLLFEVPVQSTVSDPPGYNVFDATFNGQVRTISSSFTIANLGQAVRDNYYSYYGSYPPAGTYKVQFAVRAYAKIKSRGATGELSFLGVKNDASIYPITLLN